MPEQNIETKSSNQKIRIVTTVLTKALKVWLRSQVSQISQLEVKIQASDRQLLSGCIPSVSIFATHAVYKDLHLSQVQLVAENIRINIGSVLKGQPLRLLETVPVVGELIVEEDDLNASLSSTLLSTALNDLLDKLLPEQRPKSKSIIWQKIILGNSHTILHFSPSPENVPTTTEICLGLELLSGNELQILHFSAQNDMGLEIDSNNKHYFDLGTDVEIQELMLIPAKVLCRGRINVNP